MIAVVRAETNGDLDVIREVNRLAFGGQDEARRKLNAGQAPLIDELERIVGGGAWGEPVKLIDADGGTRQTVSSTRQQARSGAFVLFGNRASPSIGRGDRRDGGPPETAQSPPVSR